MLARMWMNEYLIYSYSKDLLVNVWRGHKGWSINVLPREILRMNLVREAGWYLRHALIVGSLKDYSGNLYEGVWAFSSRITYISLLITLWGKSHIIDVMCLVYCKSIYLTIGSLEDHFCVLREGVLVASLWLT